MLASSLLNAAYTGKWITIAYYGSNIGDGIKDSYVITSREAGGREYKRVIVTRQQVFDAWQSGGDAELDKLLGQML
jgi:hypothetical protein